MNRFNGLFDSKFRGCQQIGFLDDTNTGMHLRVYELPAHLLTETEAASELVGVNNGASCWIASRKYSLLHMQKGVSAEHPATETRVRARVSTSAVARRTIIQPSTSQPKPRRRIHVEH